MAPYKIPSDEEEIFHFLRDEGYLLERDYLTRSDIIDALEIAGAMFLGSEQPDPENTLLGFLYWRRALTLRLMDTEDCPPIYKTPLKSKSEQFSEWKTLEDIERIEQQPALQHKIQSLLVKLRILSSNIGWSALQQHFTPWFGDFVLTELPHEGSMSAILDFTWTTVDTILRSERPHESSVFDFVKDIVYLIYSSFAKMSKDNPQLNSENLAKFVDLVLMMTDTLEMTSEEGNLQLFIFDILSRHPELVTEDIRLSLLQLVHRDGRDPFGNLLHRSCLIKNQDLVLPIIRFLVNLGADLNSINNDGNGVLHILALEPASETRDATARLLIELGAHMDMANEEWMTAADLWFETNTPEERDFANLPDWLKETEPRSLKCLSSQVISYHGLPYDNGAILPAELIPFVSLH